jgi:uncharacterized protein with FMN-binding domain
MLAKRFFITLAVLGMFAIYSLGIRHQLPVLGKPTLLANNNPGTSSPTGSTSNTSTGYTTSTGSSNATSGSYKDGTYTGSAADAYYGNVEVSATVSGGKITAVKFLQYPNTHSTSVMINQQAMPYLQQEAIQSQNANVQIISGATFTSQAFQQSLASALSQAKA